MTTYIHQQVEAARLGRVPSLVSRVPSGWVVLCDMQFLRGYCILLSDPVVNSINDLERSQRANYMCDMATVGDALMEVTGAYRINYAIFGNSEPALHAHIVPRYISEPDQLRHGPPWAYAPEVIEAHKFDLERDRPLIQQIAKAIHQRIS
jgi:diadenosine tetraphosphate (Ap4A) HIT family hydrolase